MSSIRTFASEDDPGAAECQPRFLSSRGRTSAREPDIEQALGPTQQLEMQSEGSGMRNRSVQAAKAVQRGEESSSDTSEPLTPATSEDSEQTQGKDAN